MIQDLWMGALAGAGSAVLAFGLYGLYRWGRWRCGGGVAWTRCESRAAVRGFGFC